MSPQPQRVNNYVFFPGIDETVIETEEHEDNKRETLLRYQRYQ